jgi:hypothetical protein
MITREFTSSYVQGLGACCLSIQAQVGFRPELLTVPSEVVDDFLITDIRVDKNSQLMTSGAVPAAVFSDKAVGERLTFDPVRVAQFLRISVVNQSSVTKRFSAKIAGTVGGYELPELGRRFVVGLDSTKVEARGRANVSLQPFMDFVPDRLVVPAFVGKHFRIVDVQVVGQDEYVWESLGVSRSALDFCENIRGAVSLKQVVLSQVFLRVCAENTTDSPHDFQGAFFGTPGGK